MTSPVLSSPSVERVRAALAAAGHDAIIVDLALAEHARIWAAAGHPKTVFALSFDALLRLTHGTPAELAQRTPA
jgi:prolyl-tRNA editing enzyme YbaK/EbsC (Cys-tRNA(Pro) deacylase)